MKKLFALLLTVAMLFALVACGNPTENKPPVDEKPEEPTVMTYEEYVAAEIDDEVLVEVYVQATQSWWDNKITVYAADTDGGYFIYEMACSEEDAAKLTPGTKIRVKGYKGEWAGEVEIMDATFEFVEGAQYVAESVDVTEYLGTDELIDFQNQLVIFYGLTVKAIEYKNGAPGDDIYVTVSLDGQSYSFCVERYLTGPDSLVYNQVGALKVGDVINVEGFLYWYEGVNTHITGVSYSGVMSYEEYVAAEINDEVLVEMYVQATQSWWDNKITVYGADQDGGYFVYEMACSEEDAAKLTPGTKILVKGYKGEWGGEVEIMNATFEFLVGDSFVAEAKDLTDKLGTDELINYQNQYAIFKGLTVEAIEYKNGAPGDDIYVTVSLGGQSYSFCVERYLTGPDTEVYTAVGELKAGDVVDITGYVYWYEGVNTHITEVVVK